MSHKCKMCEGLGEITAYPEYKNGDTESVGCPSCIAAEKDATIARLTAEVERLKPFEPRIRTDATISDSTMILARGFLADLVDGFDKLNGAANYSVTEVSTGDRLDQKKKYEVTVRRADKPTPHDLRKVAEVERDRLTAENAKLQQERDQYKERFGEYATCLQDLCMTVLYEPCKPVSHKWPGRPHVDCIKEGVSHLIAENAKLREVCTVARDALETCYDVTEWPANGRTRQNKAIDAIDAALAKEEGKI